MPAWRSTTRWPRWTSGRAPRSAGWCAPASSTATARSGRARSSPPTIRGRAAPVRVPRGPGRGAGGVGGETRRQDIANDLRGSVLRRTRILSLVRLRPKCGFGALSRRFATPSRSARGTDRDIPASFLRSRSSRVDPPSMKQGGSHERRHARVQRLAYVRSFDDG